MIQRNKTIYGIAWGAVIAAVYVALTGVFQPISFGPVQFRISEALCILPYFTPAAVPGLFVGCLIANILFGGAPLDIVFGSLATLMGAVGSFRLRRHRRLVCIPPILANTAVIPWVIRFSGGSEDMLLLSAVTVGIGEFLAVGVLGNILLLALERYRGIFTLNKQ